MENKHLQSFNEHSKNEKSDLSDVSSSDTITLTKEELITFMTDVELNGSWSDTSYRICRFIGIDPTDGV